MTPSWAEGWLKKEKHLTFVVKADWKCMKTRRQVLLFVNERLIRAGSGGRAQALSWYLSVSCYCVSQRLCSCG